MVSVSRIDPGSTRVTRTVKLPGDGRGRAPHGGAPAARRGRGRGVGDQPRRERVAHRSQDRQARREDRRRVRRLDDRRRRGGRLVPRASTTSRPSCGSTRARTGSRRRSGRARASSGESPSAPARSGRRRGSRAFCGGSSRGGTRSRGRSTSGSAPPSSAFGEGAVWTGNYIDGRVSRIDPRTNSVTARTSIGTPQALAAGPGGGLGQRGGRNDEGRPHDPRLR